MIRFNHILGAAASAAVLTGLMGVGSTAQAGGLPGYQQAQEYSPPSFFRRGVSSSTADAGDAMRTSKWDFFGSADLSTNYVFRGKTQTDDKAALSVELGTSYDFLNGRFYGSVWASNVDKAETIYDNDDAIDLGNQADYEVDFTLGYAAEHKTPYGNAHYDVGVIAYTFPNATSQQELDETHVFVQVGFENLSIHAIAFVDGDDGSKDIGDNQYYSVDYRLDLPDDWGLEFHYGIDDIAGDSSLNQDYSITVTRWGFHLGLLATAGHKNDYRDLANTFKDGDRINRGQCRGGRAVGTQCVGGTLVHWNQDDLDSQARLAYDESDEDLRLVFGYTYDF